MSLPGDISTSGWHFQGTSSLNRSAPKSSFGRVGFLLTDQLACDKEGPHKIGESPVSGRILASIGLLDPNLKFQNQGASSFFPERKVLFLWHLLQLFLKNGFEGGEGLRAWIQCPGRNGNNGIYSNEKGAAISTFTGRKENASSFFLFRGLLLSAEQVNTI